MNKMLVVQGDDDLLPVMIPWVDWAQSGASSGGWR